MQDDIDSPVSGVWWSLLLGVVACVVVGWHIFG